MRQDIKKRQNKPLHTKEFFIDIAGYPGSSEVNNDEIPPV